MLNHIVLIFVLLYFILLFSSILTIFQLTGLIFAQFTNVYIFLYRILLKILKKEVNSFNAVLWMITIIYKKYFQNYILASKKRIGLLQVYLEVILENKQLYLHCYISRLEKKYIRLKSQNNNDAEERKNNKKSYLNFSYYYISQNSHMKVLLHKF